MDQYLAQIVMFGGNFAPRSWHYCDGSLLSIAQNTALFALLGTTYGGDGQATYALPDLRGRIPVGTGQGPALPSVQLGERAGTETFTLTNNTMPAHNHTLYAYKEAADQKTPAKNLLADTGTDKDYTPSAPNVVLNSNAITPVGAAKPVSNVQAYLAINYIIAVEGMFPSRN